MTAPSTQGSPRVSTATWMLVAERDRRCVARTIDRHSTPCRGRGGDIIESRFYVGRIRDFTVDHVQEDYGRMAKRPPGDLYHLVLVCWGHHLWTEWVVAHKDAIREYLDRPRIVAFNDRHSR